MNKESVPQDERLAYHEAGHALMAIDKGIELVELAIPRREPKRRSKFATLSSLGNLALLHWPDACRAIDRYVMFRLAGPAAECARIERQHGMASGSDELIRLRARFSGARLVGSHSDFDTSFALLFAWFGPETGPETEQILGRYWLRACEVLNYGPMWAKIELIAKALLANRRLSREEVHEIYGETVQ